MTSFKLARRTKFTYKNYNGKVEEREAYFDEIFYGTTEYHPEPQWIIKGWDYSRQAHRTYAMRDMSNVRDA